MSGPRGDPARFQAQLSPGSGMRRPRPRLMRTHFGFPAPSPSLRTALRTVSRLTPPRPSRTRRRRALQAVAARASGERACGSLYTMAVSRTGRPATVIRRVARSMADRYADSDHFPMTASLTPECLRETQGGSAGIVSGTRVRQCPGRIGKS